MRYPKRRIFPVMLSPHELAVACGLQPRDIAKLNLPTWKIGTRKRVLLADFHDHVRNNKTDWVRS